MRGNIQKRPWQIFAVMAMLICLVMLLVPHAANSGSLLACVLFFPVFLFGLLDLAEFMRNAVCADDTALPRAPTLGTLFQRPPPTIN
jgi:hypothetical protein